MGEEGVEVILLQEDTNNLGDYTISDVKVGETFWSQIYKTTDNAKGATLSAKVIDLTKLDNAEVEHIKKRSFKIIPYLIKNPAPGIVACFGIYLIKEQKLILVEELMTSTLDSAVKQEGAFDETKAKAFAKQVADALHFLHEIGAAHQNVSALNIWRNPEGVTKLAAIEYATTYWDSAANEARMHKAIKQVKAGRHIAPEITAGGIYDPTKADAYSLGVLICFMLLAGYPYDSEKEGSFEEQWTKAFSQIDSLLSDPGKQLLQSLLKLNPVERMSVKEALTTTWLA